MKVKQLKHRRIEQELRQLAKTLPAGAKLPAERDLAIEYKCSFLTVRKALKHLVDDGIVVRRVGSGTFTLGHPGDQRGGVGESSVGLLIYRRSGTYAFQLMQAMAQVALTDGINLRSCWLTNCGDEGLRQAEALVREGCRALTLPWFPFEIIEEVRSFVQRCPLPVSLPVVIPGLESFCFEDAQLFGATLVSAMNALCRYFVHLGCQHIAFLGPASPRNTVLLQRLGAYSCFTSRENLPNLCGLVAPGAAAMDALAQRWKPLCGSLAVISYDDEHALRFMTAMHKLGLGAPGDYAIVGYNNSDASHYSDPPLTTVQQNFDYIGRSLLQSAIALSKHEVHQSRPRQMMDFIVRSTCGGHGQPDDLPVDMFEKMGLRIVFEDAPTTPHAPTLEMVGPGWHEVEAALSLR